MEAGKILVSWFIFREPWGGRVKAPSGPARNRFKTVARSLHNTVMRHELILQVNIFMDEGRKPKCTHNEYYVKATDQDGRKRLRARCGAGPAALGRAGLSSRSAVSAATAFGLRGGNFDHIQNLFLFFRRQLLQHIEMLQQIRFYIAFVCPRCTPA